MSTSAYYNFMTTTADKMASPQTRNKTQASTSASLEARRRSAMSSSPFANCSSYSSSSNTSSSSLNQFNSLTQTVTSIRSTGSDSSSSNSSSSGGSNNQPSSNCSSSSVASSTTSTPNPISSSSLSSTEQNHQQPPTRDLQRKSSMTMSPAAPRHHHSSSQMFHSYTLHSLEPKPFKPFKTKSDYIEAMKEDLAEWLNRLYQDLDLTVENFFSQLETGAIICRHANNVTLMGRNFIHDSSLDHHNNPSNSLNYANEPNNTSRNRRASSNSPMSSASSNDFSLCSTSSTTTTKSTTLMSPRQSITSLSRAATDINWSWVKILPYKEQAKPGTFFARDNICQFILWCRSLNILECLLFETDDLVARKNEKSFILCLLEVARIGFKVGMPTPLIIQLEQEIDREIEEEAKLEAGKQNQITTESNSHLNGDSCCDLDESSSKKTSDYEHEEVCAEQAKEQQLGIVKKLEPSLDEEQAKQSEEEDVVVEEEEEEEEEDYGPKPQVITNDLVSLHEKVVQLLCQCTCPTQFPMVRVGNNGKYKIGDKLIIFVRILRRHIMVRVGGGWQELSEFLRAKDPCRSKLNFNHGHHHHSTVSVSPLSSHHHHSNHHGSHSIRQASFSAVSRSRLLDNGSLLNCKRPTAGCNNSALTSRASIQRANSPASNSGRHRFISGSASMSWISNNS